MTERLTGDYRKDLDRPYLGHWDVPGGTDYVYTIDHCEKQDIKSQRGTERKTVMVFRENVKPLILNVVNRKSISKALGSTKYEDWEGRQIALYEGREPKAEDGFAVRIRDYAPVQTVLICEDCGNPVKDAEISGKMYRARAIAERSRARFGRCLCAECAGKEAADA